MKKPAGRHRFRAAVSAAALVALSAGSLALAPAAVADDTPVEGTTVTANPDSPTGYTVTFVYYNPNATQVQLTGALALLDIATGTAPVYQPEQFQPGRYHTGTAGVLRDLTKDANGYWSVSLPLHAGNHVYWYQVWDPTQGWVGKHVWDPASTNPRPPTDTTFRVRNNDVYDAVQVPYDPKQNDPVLEQRGEYEVPVADPADRGTVQYVEYTTILGDDDQYLGVYLPPGYDPDRAEPYNVAYMAHGIFGDETDFMIPISAPIVLDNLIAKGEIEPTVMITMGNHFTGDGLNFASYNQQNAADNLVQTILPFVEEHYNVSDEREGRAYGGFSYGAMTSSHVMRTYPTTFGYYGLISGSPSPALTTADYDAFAAAVGTNGTSVFLGNGVFETFPDSREVVAENLRSRGIPAVTAQVPGAHDGGTAIQLFTIWAKDHLWANADARDGVPVEAEIPEGEDGALALTVADFGEAVQLSGPQNAGDRLRFTGALPEVTVTDSRTAAQAGTSGWAVSGQADTFTSTGQDLTADHFGWTPLVLSPKPGLSAGPAVATVLDDGPGLATPSRLASANAEGRWGSATLGADLRLDVPTDTQPGTYTGMLTLSLFPVD